MSTLDADWIAEMIDLHGWHRPTEFGRSMGLYCHCGKYCPGGSAEWRKHVTRVVSRRLKETE